MKPVFGILFLCFVINTKAQTIRVLNKETKQGVDQVFVYNTNKIISAISDSTGMVDISSFSKKDTLIFTRIGFKTFVIQKINIGNSIYLSQEAINMDNITIIAEQDKEEALEYTATIDKIDPKIVKFNNPQTAAEMLELSGGVYIQKSQMGGGSPIIRGFEANRVLLVVDGVRMNNAIYRSGHLQNAITLDNSIIENTEIIYGSNSVIYGSDAIGGVVHYQTKTPKFSSEKDTAGNHSVSSYARYSSANNERTFHFDFNLGYEKIAAVTSVTFSNFGDLTMGKVTDPDYPEFGIVKYYADRIESRDTMVRKQDFSKQIGTAYSQTDVLEKIAFKVSDKVKLTLNAQYSTSSDVPRYDQLSRFEDNGILSWAEWNYGPQNRILGSINAEILSNSQFFDKVNILTHFQKIDEDRITRRFGDELRVVREEDVSVGGINIDFIKNNKNKHLYYGAEVIHNIVESKAYAENILTNEKNAASTRYPDDGSTLSTAGVYVSFKNNFTPKATYSIGGRYSYNSLKSNFKDTTFVNLPFAEITNNNNAATGNVGIAYHPNEKFKIQTSLSTGYRSPNVDDVGKVFAKDDYVMVPNGQLKPEVSYNAEAGITKAFGENKELIINVVGYYTILQNAIVRDFYTLNGEDSLDYDGETLKIQTNVNANEAIIYGTSFSLEAKLNKEFTLKSTFNYTVGENTTFGVPLGHIPPFYGRTDLIVHSDPLTVAVYAKYNGWKWIEQYSPFGEDNEDQATVKGTPAWQTFNIRVAMQLSKSFTLQAALENMLDIHYRPFASGVSAPGRNLVLTFRADI